MERLTKRDPFDGIVELTKEIWEPIAPYDEVMEALNKLAAYEDAEEQGRLIVLPCKVRDNVYLLWSCGKHGKSVSEMVVKHIDIDLMPDIEFACRKEKGTGSYWFFKPKDIGKTVFLTREEAEKALEGMNNG